jgi:hypothetical protein
MGMSESEEEAISATQDMLDKCNLIEGRGLDEHELNISPRPKR